MAYNTITQATINRVEKRYGQNSAEHLAIKNIAEARLPFESMAELLLVNPTAVKADLTGGLPLEEDMHLLLINCVNNLVPLGLERGVLPCKDNALTTEILRLLVELLQMKNQISTLQQSESEQ